MMKRHKRSILTVAATMVSLVVVGVLYWDFFDWAAITNGGAGGPFAAGLGVLVLTGIGIGFLKHATHHKSGDQKGFWIAASVFLFGLAASFGAGSLGWVNVQFMLGMSCGALLVGQYIVLHYYRQWSN